MKDNESIINDILKNIIKNVWSLIESNYVKIKNQPIWNNFDDPAVDSTKGYIMVHCRYSFT